jgi:hypothetical protein
MEKLKVKERELISHLDIALGRYKDLAFRACDKSKSYCRPLVKYPHVDVFSSRARCNVCPDSVSVSSEGEKSRPVDL